MPAVMSHISCVQTPVKASGKNSNTVFFLPKLSLSLTSTRPDAFLDLSEKSGAFEPTGIAIILFRYCLNRVAFIVASPGSVKAQVGLTIVVIVPQRRTFSRREEHQHHA